MGKYLELKLEQLNVWTNNPRIAQERIENENEAISFLFEIVGQDKMKNLMKDVSQRNLDPNKMPIVVYNQEIEKYDVYDGNRRISALKSLALKNEYSIGIENYRNITLDSLVNVYCTDKEDAMELLLRDHSAQQNGVGQISWDSYERDYHLNKMNKTPFYSSGFKVSQICNLRKKKDFATISYTELDAIFKSQKIREIFGVSDWNFDDTEFIKLTYKILLDKKPKSYSRFLPELNKKQSDIASQFIDDVKKSVADYRGSLKIVTSFKSIYKGEEFSKESCSVEFNGVLVDSDNVHISFVCPNGLVYTGLDTDIIGEWKVHANYLNFEDTISLNVKDWEVCVINFIRNKEYKINIKYDFDELVISATDSRNIDVKKDVVFDFLDSSGGSAKEIDLEGRQFQVNREGSYTVLASFHDVLSNKKIQKDYVINVTGHKLDVKKIASKPNGYFKFSILDPSNSIGVVFSFNYTIDRLINGLNEIYSDESKIEIFTASLRSLVESIFDFLCAKFPSKFNSSTNLEDRFINFYHIIESELNPFFTAIDKRGYSGKQGFKSIRSTFMQYALKDFKSLSSMLNLGAHKSTAKVDTSIIRDRSQLISIFIELSFLYIDIYS